MEHGARAHPSMISLTGNGCLGIVVDLCAGDDMDVASGGGQVTGEVGEDLTGCRMVGKEKSFDEN
jgi:hypothetical protein